MTNDPVTPVDPPGHPKVPRARFSKVAIAYGVFALLMTGWYVVDGMAGRDFIASDSSDHDDLPASVRASPGGYRSFAFWHSGYEGGK
ncbi:MAG TPA: hypothetical protein VL463_09960 [Kofleriaceae bacterium]|nr:hypothetical protein [Kofleriaceae bacterium]